MVCEHGLNSININSNNRKSLSGLIIPSLLTDSWEKQFGTTVWTHRHWGHLFRIAAVLDQKSHCIHWYVCEIGMLLKCMVSEGICCSRADWAVLAVLAGEQIWALCASWIQQRKVLIRTSGVWYLLFFSLYSFLISITLLSLTVSKIAAN